MNDPEAIIRTQVIDRLGRWFECSEHVAVERSNGAPGTVDILARPRASELRNVLIAFELKAWPLVSDSGFAKWIKQASDYVGGKTAPESELISACFLWMVGTSLDQREPDKSRMDGMLQLGQYFRVGVARELGPSRLGLQFVPSPWLFDEARGGWKPHALQHLLAKRQSGGIRAQLK